MTDAEWMGKTGKVEARSLESEAESPPVLDGSPGLRAAMAETVSLVDDGGSAGVVRSSRQIRSEMEVSPGEPPDDGSLGFSRWPQFGRSGRIGKWRRRIWLCVITAIAPAARSSAMSSRLSNSTAT